LWGEWHINGNWNNNSISSLY